MKAKIAFTYGWTDKEIESLPIRTFLYYWIAITPIEAEKARLECAISAYPYLKKPDIKKFDRRLAQDARKFIDSNEGKLASYSDIAARFNKDR